MTDEQIERLAKAFCTCTLPREEWTHGAHFATALWLIMRAPDLNVERDMPDMIRRYNESVGGVNNDTGGYHHSITLGSLHMTRLLLASLPNYATPASAFAALRASLLDDKDWLFTYWSRDRLMSVAARRNWVAPDLRPLPVEEWPA